MTAQAGAELKTLSHHIALQVSAEQSWTPVLTETDRKLLGGSLEECWCRLGTAGMWMELRGVSRDRAVIEVALELRFIDERTDKWLLREIGEETPAPPNGPPGSPPGPRSAGRFGPKPWRPVAPSPDAVRCGA
jgi:hypothetical protein